MLRIIGAGLIMAGCSGIGFWYRKRFYLGLEHIQTMRQILELFMSEIGYGKAALPECCKRVGEKVETPYKDALFRIHASMLKKESSFRDSWHAEMEKSIRRLPVSEREKEIFLSFPDCCGLQDNKMQIRAIEQYRDMLDSAVIRREAELDKRGKLAASMGIMCGLLLVIFLY